MIRRPSPPASQLPQTMRALQREAGGLHLRERALPQPGPGEALVQVVLAGVCRTDIYVARGEIEVKTPRVIGHEFAGTVAAFGPDPDQDLAPTMGIGDRVAVMPVFGCGNCDSCRRGLEHACDSAVQLGIDRDGAFAQYVCVPTRCLHCIEPSLSWREAAYAEPVAASLAVLHAGLDPAREGFVYGEGRIAELTARIMRIAGFDRLRVIGQDALHELPSSSADFVVETMLDPMSASAIFRVLRPGGCLVLKSRHPVALPLDLGLAVRRALQLRAVSYAPFSEALAWLKDPRFDVSDLLGEVVELEEWQRVLQPEPLASTAADAEAKKVFLRFAGDVV